MFDTVTAFVEDLTNRVALFIFIVSSVSSVIISASVNI